VSQESLKRTPPSEEYTEEYFLTDCGGFTDYLQGRLSLRHRKALEYLKVRRGEVILDVGCGRGELVRACSEQGAKTVGIDYSVAAVKISNVGSKVDNIVIIRASATNLPFKEEIFDKAIMLDIVEHLAPDDLMKCLKDVRRVLKKDGQVLIHTPNRWGDYAFSVYFKWASRFRANLKRVSMDFKPHRYAELHVNVMDPVSLKAVLHCAGFDSRIWFAAHPLENVPRQWLVIDKIFFFLTTIWCKAVRV